MLRRIAFGVGPALSLSACLGNGTGITTGTSDTIALCSAGYDVRLSADLAAQIEPLARGGTISAEVEQGIQGAILASPQVDATNLPGIYSDYASCVSGRQSTHELVGLLEARRGEYLAYLETVDADPALEGRIADLMAQHIAAVRSGSLVLAHELHATISALRDQISAQVGLAGPPYSPIPRPDPPA